MIWKEDDLIDILKSDGSVYKNYENNSYFFDLQKEIKLECIVLKLNNKTNIVNIEYSKDNLIFYSFDNELYEIKDNVIAFALSEKIAFRYLRICIKREDLKQINFYIRKFPLLFIAARTDGFGARITALLNAMYLADRLNCKFGFVWPIRSFPKMINDNVVNTPFIEDEKYIFNGKFLENHSYTNSFKNNHQTPLFEYMDVGNFSIPNRSVDRLLMKPYSNSWGWTTPFGFCFKHFCNLSEEEYFNGLRKAWKKICFSDSILVALNRADFEASKIGKFVNIHIRSGDMVYTVHRFNIPEHFFVKHVVSIEMAILVIELELKKHNKILICGDDIETLEAIKTYFISKLDSVLFLHDFSLKYNFGKLEQLLFELQFRSKAQSIYTSKSAFGILPYAIGNSKELINIYDFLFNKNNLYKELVNYDGLIKANKLQISLSNWIFFQTGIISNLKVNILIEHVKKSLRIDKDNFSYKISFLYCLLKKKEIIKAEKYCQLLLRNYNQDIERIIRNGLFGAWNFIFNAVLEAYKIYQYSASLRYLAALIFQKKQDIHSSLKILRELYDGGELNSIQHDKYIELLNVYITNQTTQIQNLNNTLNKTIKEKDIIINSNINHINQLQSNMQEKSTQLNQTQSKLSFQTKYGTAKT
ncbi:hypothetical protein F0J46_08925, partial [Campylobacter jejuni]|nr:hypothetical protein [Campylobacter jejuni]